MRIYNQQCLWWMCLKLRDSLKRAILHRGNDDQQSNASVPYCQTDPHTCQFLECRTLLEWYQISFSQTLYEYGISHVLKRVGSGGFRIVPFNWLPSQVCIRSYTNIGVVSEFWIYISQELENPNFTSNPRRSEGSSSLPRKASRVNSC